MEFLGDIVGALGAAVGGVATGGLLSLLTAGVKGIGAYMTRKQQQAFRREEWEREERLEELRQQGRNQDTENEIKIEQTKGSWRGLEASYRTVISEASVYKWVNSLRSLFRPTLTVLLLVMVWHIFNELMKVLQGDEAALAAAYTPKEAGAMVRYIVVSIVYTACTAATWWYGDRALTPSGAKGR